MYCLDWSSPEVLKIYGNERNDFYQRIEFVIVPCNYLHTIWGYEDTIADECVADLDAQIDYLGPLDVMLYVTEDVLMQSEYNEDSI